MRGEVSTPISPKTSVLPALISFDKIVPFLKSNLKATGSQMNGDSLTHCPALTLPLPAF